MKSTQDPVPPKNQGEGDVEAARRYNDDQKRFVDSGAVADAAEQAKPTTDAEASDLLAAEQQGREKAKGEDPTVPGANANSNAEADRRA